MAFKRIAQQMTAGLILGLSAVIYAVSNGALLVAGPLSDLIGWGIAASLITVAGGMVLGFLLDEPASVGGTDANTVSVLATVLASAAGVAQSHDHRLSLVLALAFLSTLICALIFLALGTLRLGQLVRFVPMPVTAGFLAGTGWVMISGALNIISGTPLTMAGMSAFWADPVRPELAFGLGVTAALFFLSRFLAAAFLIPLVVAVCTIVALLAFKTSLCVSQLCASERWLFIGLGELPLYGPWRIDLSMADAPILLAAIPMLLVVSFVAILTVLISVAGLELQLGREYDLEQVSNVHAGTAVGLAVLGGFVQLLSIGRTNLNRTLGGGRGAAALAAMVCLAVLFGGGPLLSYVPRAALGGLVLYVGFTMLRTWAWDLRPSVSRLEYLQSLLIFLVIAYFGYVVGFIVGVLLACFAFVVAYSSLSPARISGDIGVISSNVLRSVAEAAALARLGEKISVFRLQGHLFFGSAMKLEQLFDGLSEGARVGLLLDLSGVSSMDRSAAGALQRLLRRHLDDPVTIYIAAGAENRRRLVEIVQALKGKARVLLFDRFDAALEAAEDDLLASAQMDGAAAIETKALAAFEPFCKARDVAPGEYLCREGEVSLSVYFLREGAFEILKMNRDGEDIRLAKIRAGAMTGEMAQFNGAPRSASIRAVMPSRVLEVDEASQRRMRSECPEIARQFDRLMIENLVATVARGNRALADFRQA